MIESEHQYEPNGASKQINNIASKINERILAPFFRISLIRCEISLATPFSLLVGAARAICSLCCRERFCIGFIASYLLLLSMLLFNFSVISRVERANARIDILFRFGLTKSYLLTTSITRAGRRGGPHTHARRPHFRCDDARIKVSDSVICYLIPSPMRECMLRACLIQASMKRLF